MYEQKGIRPADCRCRNLQSDNSLFLKYKSLADQEKSVTFGGRLAEYKYYDMAPIIEKVMGF